MLLPLSNWTLARRELQLATLDENLRVVERMIKVDLM